MRIVQKIRGLAWSSLEMCEPLKAFFDLAFNVFVARPFSKNKYLFILFKQIFIKLTVPRPGAERPRIERTGVEWTGVNFFSIERTGVELPGVECRVSNARGRFLQHLTLKIGLTTPN
jgi:hypothetical protein